MSRNDKDYETGLKPGELVTFREGFDHMPTPEECSDIAGPIIRKLTGRSGFDEAFAVDSDIRREIEEEMGLVAFKAILAVLSYRNGS